MKINNAAHVAALFAVLFAPTLAHASETPVTAAVTKPITPSSPATPVPVIQAALLVPVTAPTILRAGVEVPLTLREELTTKKKKLRVGYRFQMEVASDIRMNNVVIIPAGTPVIGEVTEIRNKGMWGKSGYIGARVLSARVGDRQIRLTGTFDDKGVTGTGGVVAAVAFIPIAGFVTTGTSALIPLGAPVKSFLDEDIAFQAASEPLQTLTVSAPIKTPVAVAN
jgi:hypothetical protein